MSGSVYNVGGLVLGSVIGAGEPLKAARSKAATNLKSAWSKYLSVVVTGRSTYSVNAGTFSQAIYGYNHDIKVGSGANEAKKELGRMRDLLFTLDKGLTMLGMKRDPKYRIYTDKKGNPLYTPENVGNNFVEMVYDMLAQYYNRKNIGAGAGVHDMKLGNKTVNSIINDLKSAK